MPSSSGRRLSAAVFFCLLSAPFACLTSNAFAERFNTATSKPHHFQPVAYNYRIENILPSHADAFVQGFEIHNHQFYISAGQYGESRLYRHSLSSKALLREHRLNPRLFAEGLTVLDNKVYQLTWRAQTGFIYAADSLQQIATFSYQGEGWGLCNNGRDLIMSNGTDQLQFIDPASMQLTRTLRVTNRGQPLHRLNELEWVDPYIYANIWQTDRVVMIDPDSGQVVGEINFRGLLPSRLRTAKTDVLNGIAYDKTRQQLYITGKYWPRIYQVSLQRPE